MPYSSPRGHLGHLWKNNLPLRLVIKQECIPVGYVPAAHWPYAAVCFWGVSVPRGSDPRGVSALGGVCSQGLGGVSALGGVWSWGCLLLVGGVHSRGWGLLPEGVCSGGCLLQGVSAPGGCIPACTEADTLPPPRGQNSWHTLVKILPWPNFVAAGKYIIYIQVIPAVSQIMCVPIAFLYKAYLPPRKTPNTRRHFVGATIGLTVLFILFGWSVKLNF